MTGRFLKFFSPFVRIMPEIKQPQREVQFREKFIWTVVVLIIYLIMSNVPLYGVTVQDTVDYYYWLRVILASHRGSLTELGIGPIVTAGLIMQLLLGSKIIKVDMRDPYDRAMFSGSQKVLAMMLTVFNGIAYIAGGAFGDLTIMNATLVFFQILFAGLVILLLDELLQKGWGIGSGVSLFIAAGVAGQIFWNTFSFIESDQTGARGVLIAFIQSFTDPNINTMDLFFRTSNPNIVGGITTLVIFVIVIWFESTRIEIPLAYKGHRGFTGKYPMKLLYVSNIPVILVNALYANFLFFGQLLAGPDSALRNIPGWSFWLDLIGTFSQPQQTSQGSYLVPKSGLLWFLTPPRGLADLISNPGKAGIYLIIFIILCVMLGRLWVEVSGLAPRDIAQQILDSGMQVPGFRSSERIIERILKRYIPTLVILNGMIIAVMSFFADSLGALTSGTGLLISIGIIHQYAESLSKEMAASQYPGMRGLLGLD
jgi:protein transport protein SEC61 subunit alpha